MRKITLALAALFSTAALPVLAADMAARPYTKAPPMIPAPIYNWTGFYVGGHLGAAFENSNVVFGGNDNSRFMGGGQVGADYQFGNSWVVGVEAQYSFLDRNNNNNGFLFPGGTFSRVTRGLASFTGRVG